MASFLFALKNKTSAIRSPCSGKGSPPKRVRKMNNTTGDYNLNLMAIAQVKKKMGRAYGKALLCGYLNALPLKSRTVTSAPSTITFILGGANLKPLRVGVTVKLPLATPVNV